MCLVNAPLRLRRTARAVLRSAVERKKHAGVSRALTGPAGTPPRGASGPATLVEAGPEVNKSLFGRYDHFVRLIGGDLREGQIVEGQAVGVQYARRESDGARRICR